MADPFARPVCGSGFNSRGASVAGVVSEPPPSPCTAQKFPVAENTTNKAPDGTVKVSAAPGGQRQGIDMRTGGSAENISAARGNRMLTVILLASAGAGEPVTTPAPCRGIRPERAAHRGEPLGPRPAAFGAGAAQHRRVVAVDAGGGHASHDGARWGAASSATHAARSRCRAGTSAQAARCSCRSVKPAIDAG